MFEHMPSKFWCNMRLQLHILPKKNEGAVTLDKSSCIFSGITIHEMTTYWNDGKFAFTSFM